jgi:Na+/H+ antiporter NhaA
LEGVSTTVGLGVKVGVSVGSDVGVTVAVAVAVGDAVAVLVAVAVGDAVGVGIVVGDGFTASQPVMNTTASSTGTIRRRIDIQKFLHGDKALHSLQTIIRSCQHPAQVSSTST